MSNGQKEVKSEYVGYVNASTVRTEFSLKIADLDVLRKSATEKGNIYCTLVQMPDKDDEKGRTVKAFVAVKQLGGGTVNVGTSDDLAY